MFFANSKVPAERQVFLFIKLCYIQSNVPKILKTTYYITK